MHFCGGCLLAVLLFVSLPAAGQTDALWLTPTSGNWSNPAHWSSQPAYPNNVGANTYTATVAATGGAYTISIDSSFTINGLTLNSASATITQTSSGPTPGIIMLNGLDIEAGSYLLGAGTLTTANLSGGGGFSFDEGNASSQTIQPQAGGTLTIAANTTVHSLTGSGTVGRADGTVVNNGTLVADTNHFLAITGDHWVNNGTIKIDGGSIKLGGTVTTAALGTIVNTGLAGSGLYLEGTIDNSGSTLALSATTGSMTLNNVAKIVGGTVSGSGGKGLIVAGGTPILDGTTIGGAGLTVAGGGVVQINNGLTLSGATITLGDTSSFYGTMQFAGAQTLGGTGELQLLTRGSIKPSSGTLTIGPGVTVRSKGFYSLIGDANFGLINQGTIAVDATSQFMDAAASSLENQGTMSFAGGSNTITNLNNSGAVNVTGGSVRLLGAWHNAGTITNTNAILDLAGTFSLADVGTINRTAGTVRVSGTMDLGGGALALNATTGSWVLTHNGRLKNGSITTAGGAALQFVTPGTPGGALENITVATDLTIPDAAIVTVYNGLTLANKTIAINAVSTSKPTSMTFSGTQTLGGTGEIDFTGPYAIVAPAAGTLTIAPGVTIRSTTGGGTVGAADQPLINKGTINSNANNQNITVIGSTFTNLGTIKSTTGAYLTISNFNNQGTITAGGLNLTFGGAWHNAGTITTTSVNNYLGGTFSAADIGTFHRIGGGLNLIGILDNTGNTLNLDTTFNGPVKLFNQIIGGTIVGSTASPLTVSATGSGQIPLLDGVTINTDLAVSGSSDWRIINGLTMGAGRKVVFDGGAQLLARNDQTISGGEFQFSQPQATMNTGIFKLTLSAGTTIKSTGASGGVVIGNASAGSVVNNGLIDAASPGGYISLVGNFTNLGTVRVDSGALNLGGTDSLGNWGTLQRNGGTINFVGTLNNAGNTIDLTTTPVGAIDLGGGASILGGTITSSGGRIPKVVRAAPTSPDPAVFTNVTLATPLDIHVAVLGVIGDLTLSGNPVVRIYGAAGTTTGITFNNAGQIIGQGTFSFEDATSTSSQITATVGLTIGPSVTVRTTTGAGSVVASGVIGASLTNQGTISAAASGKMLTINGTFTNAGTVEARNGGTLNVASTTTTNLVNNTLTGGNWAVYAGSTLLYNNKIITTNAASVTLDGVNSTFAAIAPMNINAGNFSIDHGRNFTTAGALANSGTLLVGVSSTLTVSGALTNTGQIEGLGNILANVTSSGTVSPGESPGMLTIVGNFTQTAQGILDIQIKGPNPGTDYDVLRVTGTATVGGTLKVTLLNGYVPPEGLNFDFLQTPTRLINFEQIILPDNVTWDTAALASGRLTATPEPSVMVLIPMAFLMVRRRRLAVQINKAGEGRGLP